MTLKRAQCPKCAKAGHDTAKDNLTIFPEGHKHCFACGYHVAAEGDAATEQDSGSFKRMKLPKSKPALCVPNHPKVVGEATLKRYGVRHPLRKTVSGAELIDESTLVFPYFTLIGDDAVLTGVKRRNYSLSKKQGITWDRGSTAGVFGLNVHTGSRTLILCEGEPDTLAMFENVNFLVDVWGIQGATSTSCLRKVTHLFERYTTIVLAFDPDYAGEEAVERCLEYLPEYKVRLCDLKYDVSETVEKGLSLTKVVKKAKKLGSSSIIYGQDLTKAYLSYLTETSYRGFDTGFDGVNAMLGGELKRTECLMLVAHTGVGKSTLTLNLAYNIAHLNKAKILWVTTEMLYHQMVHKAVELDLGREVKLTDGKFDTALEDVADSLQFISEHFVFYTEEMSISSIEEATKEAIAVRDVGVLVIDVLNDIDQSIADWKEARAIMGRINALAQGSPKDKRPPIAVILVAHSKQRDGKYAHDISLSDIAGGSTLVRQCTAIMAINGEIKKRRRFLSMLKLPRMGTATKTECELIYSVKDRIYEEVKL